MIRIVSIWVISLVPMASQETTKAGGCVRVTGDRLYARDLAAAVPELAAAEPGRDLGPAPLPGTTRLIEPASLGGKGASFCVEQVTRSLTESELIDAIRAQLPGGTELELVSYSKAAVSTGAVEFPLKGLMASSSTPPRQLVLWRGHVAWGSRSIPVWARVRLQRMTPCVKAARDLPVGTRLSEADIRFAECAVFPTHHPRDVALADLIGRSLRARLKAGAEITVRALMDSHAVRTGEQVKVEFSDATVRLVFSARAQTPGQVGESVWLRREGARRSFRAVVTGEKTARLGEAHEAVP